MDWDVFQEVIATDSGDASLGRSKISASRFDYVYTNRRTVQLTQRTC